MQNVFRDNRTSQTRTYGAEAAQTVSYGYNPTSMLQGEGAAVGGASTPALSKSYAFDAMGNRTGFSDVVAHTQVTSAYNNLNQLTSTTSYDTSSGQAVGTGSSSFGYDGDGNMSLITGKDATGTTTGQTTYAYDDASRLIGITSQDGSKWQFVYDGMSRLRISRQLDKTGALVPGSEVHRVYLGMDVVQERDANNSVTASYSGGLSARSTATGTVFYGFDGNGNVTALTDATGAVVGSYTYDAWGNILNSSGPKAQENPYRYSGKEQLAGYYSYGFRFYNSALGRWINRDPIRESGGVNLYALVGNNVINDQDEYGLIDPHIYMKQHVYDSNANMKVNNGSPELEPLIYGISNGVPAAVDGVPSLFGHHPLADRGYYNPKDSWVPYNRGAGAVGTVAGALAAGIAYGGCTVGAIGRGAVVAAKIYSNPYGKGSVDGAASALGKVIPDYRRGKKGIGEAGFDVVLGAGVGAATAGRGPLARLGAGYASVSVKDYLYGYYKNRNKKSK